MVARWFTPDWAAAHPDVVAEAAAMVAGTPDAGYLACCQAIEAWDHRDRLAAITAPTLVIGGSHDPSTPVEPHARTIAEGIPGARLEVLSAAHLATIERAAEATALIAAHARLTPAVRNPSAAGDRPASGRLGSGPMMEPERAGRAGRAREWFDLRGGGA